MDFFLTEKQQAMMDAARGCAQQCPFTHGHRSRSSARPIGQRRRAVRGLRIGEGSARIVKMTGACPMAGGGA